MSLEFQVWGRYDFFGESGMRFLLVILVVVLSACSSEPIADTDFEKDKSTSKTKELSAEELAERAEEERRAEAERLSNEANSQLEELNREFTQANSQWKLQLAKITSQDDRAKHLKSRPCLPFADQLVEVAKAYPETAAADSAWYLAAKYGAGETKRLAAAAVLDAANRDQDPVRVRSRLELLMLYCDGPDQKRAMEMLFDIANKEIETDDSFELIKKLASCPTTEEMSEDGAVVYPGDPSVREKAIRQLKLFVQTDVSSERAVECLELLFNFGPEQTQDAAFRQLITHHIDHPTTVQLTRDMSGVVTKQNEDRLHEMIEKSSGTTRVNALVSLSRFYESYQREAQLAEATNSIEDEGVGSEHSKYLKEGISSERMETLEQMLTKYVEDNEDLLKLAKRELFVIQKLALGQKTPEITGQDLKGEEFALSQYRGKVVLLSFWGNWCDDCRKLLDDHQSLVERLDGKLFVVVGVNSDLSREAALKTTEDKKIKWRSFWDGRQGKQGPISTEWRIEDWPTTYLIDKDGVIRHKNLRGDSLDRAVDALLKELGEEVELQGDDEQATEPKNS